MPFEVVGDPPQLISCGMPNGSYALIKAGNYTAHMYADSRDGVSGFSCAIQHFPSNDIRSVFVWRRRSAFTALDQELTKPEYANATPEKLARVRTAGRHAIFETRVFFSPIIKGTVLTLSYLPPLQLELTVTLGKIYYWSIPQ